VLLVTRARLFDRRDDMFGFFDELPHRAMSFVHESLLNSQGQKIDERVEEPPGVDRQ
jgi:hypothetical protein